MNFNQNQIKLKEIPSHPEIHASTAFLLHRIHDLATSTISKSDQNVRSNFKNKNMYTSLSDITIQFGWLSVESLSVIMLRNTVVTLYHINSCVTIFHVAEYDKCACASPHTYRLCECANGKKWHRKTERKTVYYSRNQSSMMINVWECGTKALHTRSIIIQPHTTNKINIYSRICIYFVSSALQSK